VSREQSFNNLGCVLAELVKGEALWPGKSDVDQLYLIRSTVGDLLQRHMLAFKNNDFFQGIILPVPQQTVPLEAKLPMCNQTTIDFLKVTQKHFLLQIMIRTFQKCLDKDPLKRWTCDMLLTHDYFENFNFKVDETDTQNFEKLSRDRSRVTAKNRRCNFNEIVIFRIR
jgi:cyclin-dependent kinase-like